VVLEAKERRDALRHEPVIFFLGKSGDGHCSHHSGALHDDGEATARGRVFQGRDEIFFRDRLAEALQELGDIERAVADEVDGADFTFHPLVVVERGAFHAGMEEQPFAPPDVDRYGQVSGFGLSHDGRSEIPCRILVEGFEPQGSFLFEQGVQHIFHRSTLR